MPRVLLNREPVGPFLPRLRRPTDLLVTGDLVGSVRELVRMCGWEEDLRKLEGEGEGEGEGSRGALERDLCSSMSGLSLGKSQQLQQGKPDDEHNS